MCTGGAWCCTGGGPCSFGGSRRRGGPVDDRSWGGGERGGAPRGHSTASACRMSCGSVEWLLWGIADAAGVSATTPACSAHGRRARSGWAGSVEAGPWRLAALAPHIPCTRGVLAAEMWVCQLRGGCRDSRFAHQAVTGGPEQLPRHADPGLGEGTAVALRSGYRQKAVGRRMQVLHTGTGRLCPDRRWAATLAVG